jgi:hypothetical protein
MRWNTSGAVSLRMGAAGSFDKDGADRRLWSGDADVPACERDYEINEPLF